MSETPVSYEPVENTPTEYVSIRVHLVQVKRRKFFGFKDEIVATRVLIPDNSRIAFDVFCKIAKTLERYGIPVEGE